MTSTPSLWRLAGLVVAVLAAGALRWLTAAPMPSPLGDSALVRLSWSARPEFIEHCRRLSDEELSKRPAHMRMRLQCEGKFARYVLVLTLGDSALAVDTVRGGGLRHDRPLQIFREFASMPGTQRLRVLLSRLDTASAETIPADASDAASDTLLAARADREFDERRRRAAEAIPSTLALDTLLTLAPGRVVLVTYDGIQRRLVARMER